ncbi:MAG: bifunctional 2',3'-cyclic-nucleotide 2'-phosphodiesterase/3'-nucleotidase [Roseiarcus sp.]|jgi:2',3'-cyclic-nucleotide 2'-phosphodiesterase/3'-nucleotidase
MSAGLFLRLIGTSDLHANIFAYDYYRDRPDDTVGLAKTASLVARARAEVVNAILFDNGDIIQGSPLGDYAALSMGLKRGEIHPMIGAMNELGYAACAIGNHEFNYGLDFLEVALAGANFPALSCNILRPDGSLYFKPWLILEPALRDQAGVERRLRIGVIGFTPPQIAQWDQSHLNGRATTIGIVEAARVHVPALRAEGVDLVVALCHSGVSRKPPPRPGEENAALALAAVGGIDAMFLGHQHLLLPGADFAGIDGVDVAEGALHGVPAVMPGFWGGHLGVIDLSLERAGAGWRVAAAKVEARPIYRREGDAVTALIEADVGVLAAAKAAHEATLAYVRSPVGEIASPINSYFALVADDPSVQIVNAAQIWYVNRLARTLPALAGLPILSAAAPFKSGGRGGPDYYTDVEAGPIAIKNVADLYLYPNALRAVKIDGATLREWLERSAGLFLRIDPDSSAEQPLLDANFASYNFDVIDGVNYEIDVTQPSRYDSDGKLVAPDAHRIGALTFRGEPIDPSQFFIVVTNNYRANGGGNFPGCDGSTIVLEAPDTNRDVMVRYIVETRRLEPKSDGNWRFTPWPPQVVATFATSPAAAGAAPPSSVTLTPMGAAAGGFIKYRVEPK